MLATMTKTTTKRLVETTTAAPARVDTQNGVLRSVKVLGHTSLNNREYTDTALRNATGLFEGSSVFINHPSRAHVDDDRDVRDKIGQLRNVTYKEGKGIFADLFYLKSHQDAAKLAEAAERFPQLFALSIHASGRTESRNGQTTVQEITSVRSVDLVSDAATNSGLFESVGGSEYERALGSKDFGEWVNAPAPSNITEAVQVAIKKEADGENALPLDAAEPKPQGIFNAILDTLEDMQLSDAEAGARVQKLALEWRKAKAAEQGQPVTESRLRGITGRYISMLPAPCETLETFARLIR